MKIIFDSEEQKENFLVILESGGCPGYVKLKEDCYINSNCKNCWQQAIETEVKPNESNL